MAVFTICSVLAICSVFAVSTILSIFTILAVIDSHRSRLFKLDTISDDSVTGHDFADRFNVILLFQSLNYSLKRSDVGVKRSTKFLKINNPVFKAVNTLRNLLQIAFHSTTA